MIIAFIYDSLLLDKVSAKKDAKDLRIGYINLHASKVTLSDLKKLESYNCDLWLFLEWNGHNFEQYPAFLSKYIKNYEYSNRDTYGVLILSVSKETKVINKSFGKAEACNYPIQLIQYRADSLLNIYLAHAPPPVPSCLVTTEMYFNRLTSLIAQNKHGGDIIIGDLNSLPYQKRISDIKSKGYSDAQQTLGLIPQGTFSFLPWLPNFVKLDYVFYKDNAVPKQLARFSINTSDHTGWVADFSVKTR